MTISRNISRVTVLFVVWAFVLGLAFGPQPAQSIDLGGSLTSLIKIFGIGWVVSHFADDIDHAINSVLAQHDAEIEGYTKVVPIIRVGGKRGTAVGAAQIMGPQVQVNKVQAVAEMQINIGVLRGRALIPVSTKNVGSGQIKGVGGVGISANIKFPI
ncbi:MAG: hypothetical protein J7M38_03225 [Armatimonadetes bacterium]|nr:hypothetical protein [Armatimonadota bacterium]